jgi:Pathogenicity locus
VHVKLYLETTMNQQRAPQRALTELISIGPAMLRDFELLGIRSVADLARRNPRRMYAELNRLTGQRQDPCVLDTFCAAVAQARNPRLPAEKCRWWYWSGVRKARAATK